MKGILTALPNPGALPDSAVLLPKPATVARRRFRLFWTIATTTNRAGLGRLILLVDEFEQLLEPQHRPGFPVPQFFNGLRALITDNQLVLVVASRLPLAVHFQQLPAAMRSTFPT